jgi:calcium-translocating P-type ATPase
MSRRPENLAPADRPLVSPFIAGDPIRLGADVASAAQLTTALGLGVSSAVVDLVPGVALVVVPTPRDERLSLRWVQLPHQPVLRPGGLPSAVVLVLLAPPPMSAEVVHLAARLRSCLGDAALVAETRRATTRPGLVHILAPAERDGGEAALADQEIFTLLGSGPDGLPAGEAARRLASHGPNRLERVARRSLAMRLLAQFTSLFALLLWAGGALAFLAGLSELGWAVFVVIVVNGLFSFFQEYRAERAIQALQRLLPREVVARRDGAEVRVPVVALVPGDVVILDEGQQVPADGQLLQAAALRVDQSVLTGESHPVFKLPARGNERARVPRLERHELVFAGTAVVAGQGWFVVTATGMTTEIGVIAQLTQSVAETPSPLQREMTRITRLVGGLAVAFGVIFFALGVASGTVSVADGLLFALGVIVANVPEGLLPTLTLALALGVQRLARAGALVKRLSAVEALGATTVICSDKTGTLTLGAMAVRFVGLGGRTLAVETAPAPVPADVRELLEVAVLASQATLERGDPTEVALVAAAAARAGVDPEGLRRMHPLLAPYPFDSFRKRMTLVRAAPGGPLAFVKGAPKEILALCGTVRAGTETRLLTDADRGVVLAEHDRLAADGLRLLGVAVRPVSDALLTAPASAIERDLTFLGFVALWDPPRPEVETAVAMCRTAGIRVVMVTGDYGLTAQAIARRIGLPVTKVVTGEEVERLSPAALRGLAGEPGVLFARTSPSHKLAIVTALRAAGEVVAVTGDGVNDAPALKAADIGVAMGRRGSDVAKEAAEVVLTDDNFASIVAAIREGRATYANMGKFVTYIFASNVPELVPFLAFVFLHIPLPLTIMQILAVDLGTDLLPALALGAEPPESDVMARPPRAAGARLLNAPRLLRAYAFLGVAEAALAMLAFFWTYWLSGWRPGMPMAAEGALYQRATTMTLVGIVAAQIGNVFACRTDRESVFRVGILGNRLVLVGIAAEVAVLLGLILVPPLRAIFGLVPPTPAEWMLVLAFPAVILLLDESRKLLQRGVAGAHPR